MRFLSHATPRQARFFFYFLLFFPPILPETTPIFPRFPPKSPVFPPFSPEIPPFSLLDFGQIVVFGSRTRFLHFNPRICTNLHKFFLPTEVSEHTEKLHLGVLQTPCQPVKPFFSDLRLNPPSDDAGQVLTFQMGRKRHAPL